MKKALWYMAGGVFLLSALVFAADKSISETIKADAVKTNTVKAAKMNATGKVIEISDESIKIERTVRGNVEVMQFALENSTENITVNDTVKIAYINQGGKLVAHRVAKVISKKKEVNPAGEKSTSANK
jgi:HD superfamily phosphohydrolase YqeK